MTEILQMYSQLFLKFDSNSDENLKQQIHFEIQKSKGIVHGENESENDSSFEEENRKTMAVPKISLRYIMYFASTFEERNLEDIKILINSTKNEMIEKQASDI